MTGTKLSKIPQWQKDFKEMMIVGMIITKVKCTERLLYTRNCSPGFTCITSLKLHGIENIFKILTYVSFLPNTHPFIQLKWHPNFHPSNWGNNNRHARKTTQCFIILVLNRHLNFGRVSINGRVFKLFLFLFLFFRIKIQDLEQLKE